MNWLKHSFKSSKIKSPLRWWNVAGWGMVLADLSEKTDQTNVEKV
ncbi:hypothetical protein [Spirosoma daeguense]